MTKSPIPLAAALLCTASVVHTVIAQVSPGLAFEAASIKPNDSTSFGRRIGVPGDRFEATNVPLTQLIAVAYGAPGPLPRPLANYQISGGPKWIDTDRFNVQAKAGGDVVRGPEGTERKQLMLQTLLAQRFKLVVHHEMKDMPVYALVFARRDQQLGPKLHKSDVDCAALFAARRSSNPPVFVLPDRDPCFSGASIEGVLRSGAMTMTDLTVYLSRWLDRAVLDRTGLTGVFDLELRFSAEGLPGLPTPPPGVERPANENPSIFTAVQDQLGLKLESTRAPVDILVVDHAEKPTEN